MNQAIGRPLESPEDESRESELYMEAIEHAINDRNTVAKFLESDHPQVVYKTMADLVIAGDAIALAEYINHQHRLSLRADYQTSSQVDDWVRECNPRSALFNLVASFAKPVVLP